MKIIQLKDWKGRAICPRCKIIYEEISTDLLICDCVLVSSSTTIAGYRAFVDKEKHPAIICPKCLSPAWIKEPELIPKEYMKNFVNRRYFYSVSGYELKTIGVGLYTSESGFDAISFKEWDSYTEAINNYRKQMNLQPIHFYPF